MDINNFKAANDLIKPVVEQKILVETTGYQSNRVFVFDEYVRMFWWETHFFKVVIKRIYYV